MYRELEGAEEAEKEGEEGERDRGSLGEPAKVSKLRSAAVSLGVEKMYTDRVPVSSRRVLPARSSSPRFHIFAEPGPGGRYSVALCGLCEWLSPSPLCTASYGGPLDNAHMTGWLDHRYRLGTWVHQFIP